MNTHLQPRRPQGSMLLELSLALMIFAIAVVGLNQSLNNVFQASSLMNKEQAVRYSMRSFLEETRRKPISDMATTGTDDRLGITFTTEVAPVALTWNNLTLSDVYMLSLKATYQDFTGVPITKNLSVWVYQTQADQEAKKKQ
jgi:hypothetical protein